MWFRLADRSGSAPDPGGDAPSRRELHAMVHRFARRMARHVVTYVRPGFHPDDLAVPGDVEPPVT